MPTTSPLQAIPVPVAADAANVPASVSAAVNALEAKLVMTFASEAARSSAIPAPTEGMTTYLLDVDRIDTYTGSAWAVTAHLGAWSTWTPTWSGITVGNGAVTAKFVKHGRMVRGVLALVMGSTSSFSSTLSATLPVDNANGSVRTPGGPVIMFDTSATDRRIGGSELTVTNVNFFAYTSGGSGQTANVAGTVPFAWAVGDTVSVVFEYEAVS